MIRTAAGQTGRDAYVYELQMMANRLAALNSEFTSLCTRIREELPEAATVPASNISIGGLPVRLNARRVLEVAILRDANQLAQEFRSLDAPDLPDDQAHHNH